MMLDYEKKVELYGEEIYIVYDNRDRIIVYDYPGHFVFLFDYLSDVSRRRYEQYTDTYIIEYYNGRYWNRDNFVTEFFI